MELKDFIEDIFKKSPMNAVGTAVKLIELESIERYLNVMWGVNLKITVEPAEKKEGRFFGKGVIEALTK